MDHKVSKDMISSGMIPSGEKTQADLSRTQYGSAPSPSKLMDAYKSMYDKKEEVINEHHKKDADGNTIPHEGEELNEGKIPAGLQAYLDKKKGKKEDKKEDKKDMKEEVDKFDVVFNHFISEGYSEKEAYAKMANLTEEQLDEFMKALATRAAQYGANLGKPASQKINVVNPPRKPFDAKRKPFDAKKPEPKPGDSGFKAKSASDVVNAAAAIRKNRMINDMKPKKGEVMQDEYQHQIDEIAFLAPALGKVAAIAAKGAAMAGKAGKVATTVGKVAATGAKKLAKSSLASDMARGAAMQAGSNIVSGGGGGGQQKQRTGTVSASADLFDIVKGQLLDEGLSEEEIKNIMLTLTPDEILKEIEESSMSDGSAGGAYQDLGPGGFRSKEQINRMHNDPKGTEKYGKKIMKRVGQAVRDTGTPTVRKVDESKK